MQPHNNPPLEWTPKLSVGIVEIDNQHKHLIELLNLLSNALKTGQGRQIQGDMLRALADYAILHFRTEETYMEQVRFPGLEEHRKEHQDFITKVLEFNEEFHAGNVFLTIEMMKFLREWVEHHIATTDQDYAPYLRSPLQG